MDNLTYGRVERTPSWRLEYEFHDTSLVKVTEPTKNLVF